MCIEKKPDEAKHMPLPEGHIDRTRQFITVLRQRDYDATPAHVVKFAVDNRDNPDLPQCVQNATKVLVRSENDEEVDDADWRFALLVVISYAISYCDLGGEEGRNALPSFMFSYMRKNTNETSCK